MHLADMPIEHARLALRAMKAVSVADRDDDRRELALIEAAAQLIDPAIDPRALTPLEAAELRAIEIAPRDAERVVQAAIFTALIDGRIEGDEVEVVRALADAASVDEPRVRNLEQLARGRIAAMWIDLARRSWAREVFVAALEREGPRGLWTIIGPMIGRAHDPELVQRYLELGAYPADTLGYAYFRFIVERELGFPGEPYAVPESGTWHDIAHVLGGYGTEPEEEIEVVGFIAGFTRSDPFFWLFTIALQFHLGVRISPYSPARQLLIDPVRILAAFARGAAMTIDLSARGWDPWPYFGRSLEEVRREFNVAPRAVRG